MNDALERVTLRNHFYQDNFRRVVLILLISLFINIILLGALFFLYTRQAAPVYFASTTDGQLIQVNSRSQPIMNNQALLAWVSRNVPQLYAIDYANYRQNLQNMQQYFTPLGWQQFSTAFAPMIDNVLQNKLVVSATLYDVPVILMSGTFGGIHSWQVQVPLLVSFAEGDKVQTQHMILQLIIQPSTSSQSGQVFGITQVLEKVVSTSE